MRNTKKMGIEVGKRKQRGGVKAKKEDEVLSANFLEKKKLQSFSIKIGLNPGHHTTF